jgi:hypothetical protein
MSTTFQAPTKDPAAILFHEMDWSSWLDEGETIDAETVTSSDAALIIDQVLEASGVVTWRVRGGAAGKRYTVTVRVETSDGRTDERSVTYRVAQR